MSNSFFAGLEAFMEENPVEATATVTIQPEENIEEVSEADAAATEQGETSAEIQEETAKAEMVFAKFSELDRMIAHVEKYGVDRSFLSLCNHNNMLSNTIGMNLPSCESFDSVGSSTSAVSIAALEGLKETASKVWEFIKRMCLRMKDWIVRIVKMYDFRFNSVEKRAKALQKLCGTNTQKRNLTDEDKNKLKDVEIYDAKDLSQKIQDSFVKEEDAIEKCSNIEALGDIEKAKYEAPEKVSVFSKLSMTTADIEKYAAGALENIKHGRDLMKKDLPKLREEVAKLHNDAAAEKIDKDDAKFQCAQKSRLIGVANKSIGVALKVANDLVASGSTLLTKLYKKPGAKDTTAAPAAADQKKK